MAGTSPNPALDGESRVGEIIAILTVASILSTLVVTLRCISRGVILRSFGWDDAVMVPAQILTLASALSIGLEAKYGLGRHAWVMPDEDYIPYMKSFYASIIVYNVAVCLTKISILLQYYRIFSNTKLRKILIMSLCFLGCWGVTLCFLLPLVCIPVAAFWDPSVDGFCLDNGTIWYIMAGVNVVTDFAVFAMPIPVISSLQLPRRQKAMLMIVFALGIFPCAVAIYRIHTLAAAAKSTDPTWDNVDAATFSFLELTVGVVAVCLPTLRPILVHTMPRIFGSLLRSNGQSGAAGTGGPTGGRPSRVGYGGVGSASTTRGRGAGGGGTTTTSLFKSALRETDSTEGLRPLDDVAAARSRGDAPGGDIEFGELGVGSGGRAAGGPRRYSVSVVAGWETDQASVSELALGGGKPLGIKTTTVVTQKVLVVGKEGDK